MNPHVHAGRARANGFTLIELVAVLVLIAIGAALAAPSLAGVVSRNHTRSALDRLTADIAYARMLAVRQARQVRVEVVDGTGWVVVRLPATERADTLRRVDLAGDYQGLRLSPSPLLLDFNSRGLLQTGGATIRATRGEKIDSVTVTSLGQTHRGY